MLGILFVSIAGGLWGTVGVANSLMSAGTALDPLIAGLTRTALGALSLLAAAKALRTPSLDRGRLPLGPLAAFGLAGAVFQICLFAAYAQVGVTITVAVTVCAPVVLVVAGDAVWHRQVPGTRVTAAIAVAAAGVFLTLFGKPEVDGGAPATDLRGTALLVVASVAYAVVVATARSLARVLHPLRATGLGLAATAAVLGVAVLAQPQAAFALGAIPGRDLGILVYIGVAGTGGAYFAFVLGLHLSRSAAAGLAATLIEPGVAAILSALILNEHLTLRASLGCGLLLGAMIALFSAERNAAGQPARCKPSGDRSGTPASASRPSQPGLDEAR